MQSPLTIPLDEEQIGVSYAVFWNCTRRYYWGKLTNIFSDGEDAYPTSAEVTFLQREERSTDPACIFYDWPKQEDVEIEAVDHCIYGTAQPVMETFSRWKARLKFECEAGVVNFSKYIF